MVKVSQVVTLVCFIVATQTIQAAIGTSPSTSPDMFWLDESTNTSNVADPVITVRFVNPRFYCDSNQLVVDVEFQSDTPNRELFGINIRFVYEDSKLEYVRFKDFVSSYGAVSPNPAIVYTLGGGISLFGFSTNGIKLIDGAIQKISTGGPHYIPTTGWKKLFSIVFKVDDPNANYANFYGSVVADKEQNPGNGGYFGGSDGITISLVPVAGQTSTTEYTNSLNWNYIGSGAPPYGQTNQTSVAAIYSCAPPITCPASVTINCGDSTLPSVLGTATSPDYCLAGTPLITYSDVLSGGVCPQPNLITRIWSAKDSCNNQTYCQQYITVGTGSNCTILVTNTADAGIGSLREAINCAATGDTIKFHTSLAGSTILINSTKILLNKNLYIRSNVTPRVKIKSTVTGLFDIAATKTIEFKDLDITSGLTTAGNDGAAFNNLGTLKLIGVKVYRNPSLPAGQYLIRNKPASQFTLTGSCFIQNN